MPQEFSFAPLSRDEKNKIEKTNRDIAATAKEATNALAFCYSSDLFNNYRDKLNAGVKDLVNIGRKLSVHDPVAYGAVAFRIFAKIDMLMTLVEQVEEERGRRNT